MNTAKEEFNVLLKQFDGWKVTINSFGEIEYPPIQSSDIPEG